MIVAPCSVRSLAGIANGIADNLLLRAADVSLKERKPLVLLVRETPLNAVHLENMLRLVRLGVTIFPPVPAFYHRPDSIDDIVSHTVARALDQLGLEDPDLARWEGQLRTASDRTGHSRNKERQPPQEWLARAHHRQPRKHAARRISGA